MSKIGFYNINKAKLTKLALKYQYEVNIVVYTLVAVYLLVTVNWFSLFDWIIAIPSEMLKLFNLLYDLVVGFLKKFFNDLTTFPTNLQIVSVGIIKRFVIEDILIPLIIRFYWSVIKEDAILYYRIKYREFKKFPMMLRTALGTPLFVTITAIISYFNILGFVGYWVKKLFANTVFSKLKFFFIKFIPAAWIFLMDLPVVSIIIDYLALSKLIDWARKIDVWGINHIFAYFKFIGEWIDKKIEFVFNFFENNIGKWLQKKAIAKKFQLKMELDELLEDEVTDYHVSSKGYNHKALKKKILRIRKWREIRKQKKWDNRKKKWKILSLRIKKSPKNIKDKILGYFNKEKGETEVKN